MQPSKRDQEFANLLYTQDEKKPDHIKLTYPYERPGPGKRKGPNIDDGKIDKKFKEFNFAVHTIPNLNKIDWNEVKAVSMSESGTAGVFFVELEEGGFVVKGSPEPAIEYFASLVYAKLKIKVPQMRVMKYTDPEFNKMVLALERKTYYDQKLFARLKTRLNRPYILIQQYVTGIPITNMGLNRARMAFSPSFPPSRDRLIKIGLLMGMDTFLNNTDRYPLIWNNDGNPENILLQFETSWHHHTADLRDPDNLDIPMSDLYAIDNRPNLIPTDTTVGKENFQRYLKTFDGLLEEVFKILRLVKDGRINPFEVAAERFEIGSKVSAFMYKYSMFDIKPLGELQILLGMALCYANIVSLGMEPIRQMYIQTRDVPMTDWMNIWADNLKALNMNLLEELMKIAKRHVRDNDDIITWANFITLTQYLLKFDKPEEEKNQSEDGRDRVLSDVPSDNNLLDPDDWLTQKINEHFGVNPESVMRAQQEGELKAQMEKEEKEKQAMLEQEALMQAQLQQQQEQQQQEQERLRQQQEEEAKNAKGKKGKSPDKESPQPKKKKGWKLF